MQKSYSPEIEEQMRNFYRSLSEKEKRRYAALEAMKLGYGGQKYICRLLGCSATTLRVGRKEVLQEPIVTETRIRRAGGGRKRRIDTIENIDGVFFQIIRDNTAGSPMDEACHWTNLTIKEIAQKFGEQGLAVSEHVVKQLLKKHKFVQRKMQKTKTLKEAADRDEQFKNIAQLKETYLKEGNPVVSLDVKKKEAIGQFYREGRILGTEAPQVYDHDFQSSAEGMVIPHGIYDLKRNEGYITLGTSKDTSEFCMDCIKTWWQTKGQALYPEASSILILADGGGSNSSRHYIFKEDLQKLVDELGIEIRIAHYPPYTSKFNPIEHKMFCHVTRACAGALFTSVERVRELMNKTSTSKGFKVFTSISQKIYQTGRKVAQDFKATMTIAFDEFLGKWNYRAIPQGSQEAQVIC